MPRAQLISIVVVGVLALATLVAVVAMWPDGDREFQATQIGTPVKANVTAVTGSGCERLAGPGCSLVAIHVESGPSKGKDSFITLPDDEFAARVDPGDRIRVARNVPAGIDPELAEQLPVDRPEDQPFAFVDFERERSLYILAALFAGLVIALARMQGVRALVGLALSLLLVVKFVVPAILDGTSPVAVALAGAFAIMLVTIALTHGLGLKSVAAMLGTAGTLLLTTLLAELFVEATHITGFSSEEATLLLGGTGEDLSLQGLVLAGMVIAALGVLDDVTVSQSSTVLALRRANPTQAFGELYRGALTVGRDHLGATVNTLVLAYVGASLPILLIFSNQGTAFGEAINREPVALEIVATLVGSIGLIAAVPLTTAVAALLVTRVPHTALPSGEHAHAH